MSARLFAVLAGSPQVRRVRHYVGLPPELTGGEDNRQEMGRAALLLIEENPDGGVALYRFNLKGDCVGDTWHLSIDDAKDQAAYEYPGLVQGWQEVPSGTDDPTAFILNSIHRDQWPGD